MLRNRRGLMAWSVSIVAAALLAACGGGDSIRSVRVMGDSLADAGTFGLKFTIQGQDIFPERVSQAYGLGKGCNFFASNGASFTTNAACTNYAVGGGVINPTASGMTAQDPRGLPVQFAAAGSFSSEDLLLVDGGANDAATLVGAYLAAAQDGGAAYAGVLGTLLTPAEVGAAAAGGQAGLAQAGATYMTALANRMADLIETQAIAKGAERVVLINVPGITNTPRFQFVLAGIEAAAGPAARPQSEALFDGWVKAFNARLAARVAGNPKIVLIDFYGELNRWIASPAQYGLTNVRQTACPITGQGSDGLPTYTFATCTMTALAANPPAGATGGADWYKTWLFSDSFHPTGTVHELAAQVIIRALKSAGWMG